MNIDDKRELLKKLLKEKKTQPVQVQSPARPEKNWESFAGYASIEAIPDIQQLQRQFENLKTLSVENPYFRVNEGWVNDKTVIEGREFLSFSGYNYLGLCGDGRVSKAAKEAIDRYGTTVSASRIATGERPIHQALESAVANLLKTESALVFVSGHATNVSVIGHLMKPGDLIVYDELAHNCIVEGNCLSGARRIAFKHNDAEDCERVLRENRSDYERVLLAIEGVYSMDGDIVDLPAFIALKKKYHALMLVDEAHSIGTVGASGRGVSEYFNVPSDAVDLWMGTFSKAFASCGGYVAGKEELIRYLRYTTPGFVFSVGMTPANAAAALKSIEILNREPDRVKQLQANSAFFLNEAKAAGLNVGISNQTPVVPIIIGDSNRTLKIAHELFARGINVQPILYPAVAEEQARLRFFITRDHKTDDMKRAVEDIRVVVSSTN